MAETLRVLVVGDPHATVEDLGDCDALMNRIDGVLEADPDIEHVVFLGDLHHSHAVVRIEVMDWWGRALTCLKQRSIIMVGNHDRSHDTAVTATALQAYRGVMGVTVVDRPHRVGPLLFVPWYPSQEAFLAALKAAGVRDTDTVFCHQTFDGSRYENGFWAPDGFDAGLVPAHTIISGHIHTPQQVGKVWYPGAPRWRTASDVNTQRNIWTIDFDRATGQVLARTPHAMEGYCRAMYHFEDRETAAADSDPLPPVIEPARVTMHVYGTPDYCTQQGKTWRGYGFRVTEFPTRTAKYEVRESEGVLVALRKHVENAQPRYGTPVETLRKLVAERIRL